jgi:hypothetical protein
MNRNVMKLSLPDLNLYVMNLTKPESDEPNLTCDEPNLTCDEPNLT